MEVYSLQLTGAGAAQTITLDATADGLAWGPSKLTQTGDAEFTVSTNVSSGGVFILRFEFDNADTGTYYQTFDPQGKHNYGCNEVANTSAPMTRP